MSHQLLLIWISAAIYVLFLVLHSPFGCCMFITGKTYYKEGSFKLFIRLWHNVMLTESTILTLVSCSYFSSLGLLFLWDTVDGFSTLTFIWLVWLVKTIAFLSAIDWKVRAWETTLLLFAWLYVWLLVTSFKYCQKVEENLHPLLWICEYFDVHWHIHSLFNSGYFAFFFRHTRI